MPGINLYKSSPEKKKIDFFYTPGRDAADSFEISTVTTKNCIYYETSLIDHSVSPLSLQETHLLDLICTTK